ncbi:MAG: hypothetical protein JJE37_01250 [Methyloceanibacter sp.]|nr:hypothetical protein [Methyloceanibacter sp.]
MARHSQKLPIASAAGKHILVIKEAEWQRIENGYGKQLSEEVRASVVEATENFLYWEEFERNAEPVSTSRKLIKTYQRTARSFQLALRARGTSGAAYYAKHLVRKNFADSRFPITAGASDPTDEIPSTVNLDLDAILELPCHGNFELFHWLTGLLTSFEVSCETALNEVTAENVGFKNNQAWNRWIRLLTGIMKRNSLPFAARKDAEGKYGFVALVKELQETLPEDEHGKKKCKLPYADSALPSAIAVARRSGFKNKA